MVDYNPSKFSNALGVASLPQGNSFTNISLGSPFTILNSQFNTTSKGWGFDIGSTFHVGTGTTLGLSVCNIGLINWTKNVHQIEASSLDTLRYNGVSDFQLYNQVNDLFSGKTDLFKTTTLEKYRTSLPTQVRFGVSQNIFKVFHAGFDIVIPVTTSPGNLQQPLFSLGGEIKLTHWTIGSGYSQGGNLINGCWSAGLFWHTKKKFFECGIATRDWLSYFKPSNSNLSFAMLTAKFSAF
jgi:hypothetical protein